jgi:hypothetical protein
VAHYPAPLAVAVALSSNSSAWFTSIVLKHLGSEFSPDAANSFLSRVTVERPIFVNGPALGMALLYLLSRFDGADNPGIHESVQRIVKENALQLSMQSALIWYIIEPTFTNASEHVFLTKRMGILDKYGSMAPESLRIPKTLMKQLVPNDLHAMVWRKDGNLLEKLQGDELFFQ